MATLRERGHINSPYIDDIYLQGDTFQECRSNVADTVNLLISLNFFPHPEKTNIVISQEIDILGFHIDSRTMTIRPTEEKRDKIALLLKNYVRKQNIQIRDLAMIIGKLVATFPGNLYGPLFYRDLEHNKQLALRHAPDYDAYTSFSEASKQEIRW